MSRSSSQHFQAGLLVFGKDPQEFVPKLVITFLQYYPGRKDPHTSLTRQRRPLRLRVRLVWPSSLPGEYTAYLRDLENALDVLANSLRMLRAQVAGLTGVPEAARHVLEVALASDDRVQASAWRLYDLLLRREQVRRLAPPPVEDSLSGILLRRMRQQKELARQILAQAQQRLRTASI